MSRKTKRAKPEPGREPAAPAGEGAGFTGAIKKLFRYCDRDRKAIALAMAASALATVLQVIGPDRLKDLANGIAEGLPSAAGGASVTAAIDMAALAGIARTLLFLYAASMLLNLAQSLVMTNVTQRVSRRMRSDLSLKINRLPLSYFDGTSYGDILSRVTNDVDTIGETLQQSVGSLLTAAIMFFGALFMMFYTNVAMALTAIASSAAGFLFMSGMLSKSQKHFVKQQESLGDIDGLIEEIYAGHNVVKAYNGSRNAKKAFEKINAALCESAWKAQFLSGLMMPLMGFIGNLGYVAVCVVGASLVIKGAISFGVIVAFMVYVRLFTQPLSEIAQSLGSLQATAAAGKRVFEFLEEKELADESQKIKRLTAIKGQIEFRHVSFGYLPGQTVIHDFSASVRPGQKVAIVGPTGAGKTTIVNLLMRFYERNGGEILLDGVPLGEVPRENVREQFGMVLQDAWLFEGTIRENIAYGKRGVTNEQVEAACRAAGIHHVIKALPDGYDTVLGDKASLSEGQKQLLTIARAMVEDAPLLILDEATSSVDTRTERIVQRAMDRLTEGRTSFVIAHRLSTIKNADLILFMQDGDIVERGTNEELLKKGGFYAALYNSQFAPLA